jgi:hypothetical protein
MGAEYDSTDATGFIKLFGLPMQVAGVVDRQKPKAAKKRKPKAKKK